MCSHFRLKNYNQLSPHYHYKGRRLREINYRLFTFKVLLCMEFLNVITKFYCTNEYIAHGNLLSLAETGICTRGT